MRVKRVDDARKRRRVVPELVRDAEDFRARVEILLLDAIGLFHVLTVAQSIAQLPFAGHAIPIAIHLRASAVAKKESRLLT